MPKPNRQALCGWLVVFSALTLAGLLFAWWANMVAHVGSSTGWLSAMIAVAAGGAVAILLLIVGTGFGRVVAYFAIGVAASCIVVLMLAQGGSFYSNPWNLVFIILLVAGLPLSGLALGVAGLWVGARGFFWPAVVPTMPAPEPLSVCPACGASYDPADYRDDAVERRCSTCHRPLPPRGA